MTTTVTQDAIALLKADHREAEDLFAQYEKLKDTDKTQEKFEIAKKVCGALLIHMEIEEKLFYPRVRGAVHDDDLVNEAVVEHAGAKELIEQLGALKPDDPMFDAKIKVLSEQIEHHVEEEEKEMFPKAETSGLNLDQLGEELFTAKNKLRVEHGMPPA
ncbi:hemerythrin domain-containing protein [Oxalobacteraceae bacterium CAVE-383]|nr:hemerythrin domain-containing protein [Oxalobacteraceae bacterium CAVE-383]